MAGETSRSATEVGPGDFIKVAGRLHEIVSNTAFGEKETPRNWSIRTADGRSFDMWDAQRYYKKGDSDIPK